jgi:hypothetical protein
MLASRQIIPVAGSKWRSSLSAEYALITFLLSVAGSKWRLKEDLSPLSAE